MRLHHHSHLFAYSHKLISNGLTEECRISVLMGTRWLETPGAYVTWPCLAD